MIEVCSSQPCCETRAMPSLSRRRFAFLTLTAPLTLLGASAAKANLIEHLLVDAIVPEYDDEVWVLVDDKEATLTVYRGNRQLEHFPPYRWVAAGPDPNAYVATGQPRWASFGSLVSIIKASFIFLSAWIIPRPPTLAWHSSQASMASKTTIITSTSTAVMAILPKKRCLGVISVSTGWVTGIPRFTNASTGPTVVSQ